MHILFHLKGWKWTEAELKQEDMKHIISIHNRNNEAAWREVLQWEQFHAQYVHNNNSEW